MEEVILVDEHDCEIGTLEKMAAHQQGKLHRAFSVLIFNRSGQLLLQQRAIKKYHSGGLWTNTCCSHPQPGEDILDAGRRKLIQEMGIDCNLTFSHKFLYKVKLDNNLIEHELDHVLVGYYDGQPKLNRSEAMAWKFASLNEIKQNVRLHPRNYTPWFKLILQQPELDAFYLV
ncbi:MAG: isopentenyl-diphosphate delta-isomerase [Bacteroidetes bacterium OLB12]|nr:MAG: isopentenyl-diphosphate delta-isomerase [Bacteroidetes bacterium OLB12]HNR72891.1 isopentenyl-diphosphate Delta-isomerase [Cyclobacteriaceae bacterium]HNU43380.1 isopentenyl-diphosphate Delta-isomerase [Cyclobacteriaceae bacterium]